MYLFLCPQEHFQSYLFSALQEDKAYSILPMNCLCLVRLKFHLETGENSSLLSPK